MRQFLRACKNYIIAAAALIALAYGFVIFKRKMGKENPVTGKVVSKYGYRKHPITGEYKLHNGCDISVPIGAEVKSPWDGTVKKVYTNAVGGNQIIIEHSNGYTTGYAHLSEQLVTVGQQVDSGQVIAKSGNTGQSTGPHLHFTLRYNGELVDPQTVFDFE